ncbi:UDP-2,4-diacetamido-2,4,6-trideoxy-beta-L-altropyranose hydrolase [Herbaspirillum sp. NPDC087042]|uniref:UDP-2,4-diacetamido-2,4, 6-trideoxy-beta-L-altropyranose hydrolase n=1 Tax=Herbaspirillum sp. NPDC087042 TaxID=3364004 RepID=UPI0037FE3A51
MSVKAATRVAFRVDASLDIGSGHVMRCLTLARVLRERGAQCYFVSRMHAGHLCDMITADGFRVMPLPAVVAGPAVAEQDEYRRWLGVSQEQDARETATNLATVAPLDWLVVDHYALGAPWELSLKGYYGKLLAIDDLVNREHVADLLLDQTFMRDAGDYRPWVNAECVLLCGVEHVLLRPEFDLWRAPSLARRKQASLQRILISLGGVDRDNVTRTVLLALDEVAAQGGIDIDVVLGGSSPWIDDIRGLIATLAANVQLHVNAHNMAELLAGCDLAIGAAGTSAWERCCLGVPTLMLVLAANQAEIGAKLGQSGVACMLVNDAALAGELASTVAAFSAEPAMLAKMSVRAAALVGGNGAARLADAMMLGHA